MKEKTIEVIYRHSDGRESHRYTNRWRYTDYFCPKCGQREVWETVGAEDYYVGESRRCAGCGLAFTAQIDDAQRLAPGSSDSQVLEALRDKNG